MFIPETFAVRLSYIENDWDWTCKSFLENNAVLSADGLEPDNFFQLQGRLELIANKYLKFLTAAVFMTLILL